MTDPDQRPPRPEQLLALVLDASTDVMFFLSVEAAAGDGAASRYEYRYEAVNAAFCAQTGHARAAVLGRPLADVVPPEVLPQVRARYDAACDAACDPDAAAPFTYEETLALPAGGRTFQTRLVAVRAGAGGPVTHLLGVARDVTAERAAAAALQASEAFSRSVLEAAPEGLKTLDLDGRVRTINVPACVALELGDGAAAIGQRWTDRWPEPDAARARHAVAEARAGRTTRFQGYRPTVTGAPRWWDVVVAPILDAAGVPTRLLVSSRDISAQHAAERALAASEAELRALFAAMHDVVLVVDGDGTYLRVVPTAPDLLYRPPEAIVGRRVHDVVPPALADAFMATVRAVLDAGAPRQLEYALPLAQGETWFEGTGSPLGDGTVLWVARDVTRQKRAEAALRELATRDALTGLLNRRGLEPLAVQSLVLGRRAGRRDAMLYLDLDRFKPINDTYGHAAGDAALQAVARVLRDTVREGDLVARLGGDEFAVFAVGPAHAGEGQVLAARLEAALAAHNASEAARGRPWAIGVSIGVAEAQPGEELDALLARADAALYARKLARR